MTTPVVKPLTLADIQTLMDANERRQEIRHKELLERVNKVDHRVQQLEIREAGRMPVFQSLKSIAGLVVAAVVGALANMFTAGQP